MALTVIFTETGENECLFETSSLNSWNNGLVDESFLHFWKSLDPVPASNCGLFERLIFQAH